MVKLLWIFLFTFCFNYQITAVGRSSLIEEASGLYRKFLASKTIKDTKIVYRGREVNLGVYQHYKGSFYQLLDTCMHTETQEVHARYQALYGDYQIWIRPLAMFLEEIEIEGRKVPRFSYFSSIESLLQKKA